MNDCGEFRLRIMWEGPLYRPLSLDKVNRHLVIQGLHHGHEMLARPNDVADGQFQDPTMDAIAAVVSSYEPVDWHVRHLWPPYWSDQCGPLVLYQAWEYGAVPDSWVDPIRQRTRKLVVYSQAVCEMFAVQGIDEKYINIIPLGVDSSIFHPYGPTFGIPEKRSTTFLWIGGLIPRKGLDVLLKAYLKTFRSTDDVMLVIKTVGQNSVYPSDLPAELVRAFHDRKAPPIQVITQDLSEIQLAALYRTATAFISPYRGEGFNLPVLEAMACGTLVATSDTNPTNEFVPKDVGWRIPGQRTTMTVNYARKPGWQFEPQVEGLADILKEIARLSDDEKQARRERGLHHVRQAYTWEKIWPRWETVLSDPPVKNFWAFRMPNMPHRVVTWRSPIRNASGYASESRAFLKVLPRFGVIPRIIDESGRTISSTTAEENAFFDALERVPVSRYTPMIQAVPAYGAHQRRHGIDLVRSMFESDRVPADWVPVLKKVAGVLVPSRFNRQTFSEAGVPQDKIHVVPSPVFSDVYVPLARPAPSDRVRFISVFDWIDRKGWDILISAWVKAFGPQDPVALFIKTSGLANQGAHPLKAVQDLLQSQGVTWEQCAPIRIINEPWVEPQLVSFYQQADVFVLPTRGEGWGRPILEAMSCGLPAIATAWSGPQDFMSPENSLPLRIKGVVPVPDTTDMAILRGHRWAEPDMDHLVELLRWCVNHLEEARRLGLAARKTAEQFHPTIVTRRLITVLRQYGVEPLEES